MSTVRSLEVHGNESEVDVFLRHLKQAQGSIAAYGIYEVRSESDSLVSRFAAFAQQRGFKVSGDVSYDDAFSIARLRK